MVMLLPIVLVLIPAVWATLWSAPDNATYNENVLVAFFVWVGMLTVIAIAFFTIVGSIELAKLGYGWAT